MCARAVAVLVVLGLLSGCASLASTGLPPAAKIQPGGSERVSFEIAVPKERRHRSRFVSPATKSMSIAIAFSGKSVLKKTVNLTPGSPGCTKASGNTQCTVNIALAAKKGYVASIGTYDAVNGSGKALSIAQDVAFNVALGKANKVSLTLSGVPASIVSSVATGTSFTVMARDAEGNTIVGPGAPSFTASKTSGSTVVSIAQPTKAQPNTVTVALASPRPAGGSTETIGVTASYAAGLTNACAMTGAVCVLSNAATARAPRQVMFVGNYLHDNVLGFEVPFASSSPDPSYTLSATGPFVLTADAAGNVFVPGYSSGPLYEFSPPYGSATVTNSSSGIDQTRGAAVDSNGNLFVGNNGDSTVSEIRPPYTGAPSLTIASSSGINLPQGIAVDAGDSNTLYVGSGAGTLGVYKSSDYTTEAYTVTLASNAYAGILIANGKLFVGEASAIEIFALPITSNTPAHVTIGSSGGTNISNVTGFAVDSQGDLFAANFNDSNVLEYTAPFTDGESPVAKITSGTSLPWSLCFDEVGNLYVVSEDGGSGTGAILQFDPPFSSSSVPAVTATSGLSAPYPSVVVSPAPKAVTLTVP